MQLGIHLPHIGRKAGPESIRRVAMQAEELGFADVWVSEHIIVPKDAPYPPSPNFWDPVLTLTWAAACTSRVKLGTSVLVLPMRHPLPLAKELATLQNLSQGRLILGAGVGWMEAEFNALGVPFHERGRRMDEGIALMRAVWGRGSGHLPDTLDPGCCAGNAHAAAALRADSHLDRRFVRRCDQAGVAAGWLARQPRRFGAGGGDGAAAACANGRMRVSRSPCASAAAPPPSSKCRRRWRRTAMPAYSTCWSHRRTAISTPTWRRWSKCGGIGRACDAWNLAWNAGRKSAAHSAACRTGGMRFAVPPCRVYRTLSKTPNNGQ